MSGDVMRLINNIAKALALFLLLIIAIPLGIVVFTIVTIVWEVNPTAGMSLLAFLLVIIRLVFYVE
jgi:hypothetical protein